MMYLLAGVLGVLIFSAVAIGAQSANLHMGEAGFREHCAECHADGGNIVNPKKTLSKADREKNGIKSAGDIITIMRKPGEGMVLFDEKTLSDAEAGRIADYILTTFK